MSPRQQEAFRKEASFFMANFVYILFSDSLQKHYVGSTEDLDKRLAHHNAGQNRWSKRGRPWRMIWSRQVPDKKTALQLETSIKKRGASRFLLDQDGV
ncbi:MAG: GIY-YIG nuclease family protein [Saprospiraceae bacterium]|nr:GIY-YIG nuclease family protein [Saprospiraceae bacterium]